MQTTTKLMIRAFQQTSATTIRAPYNGKITISSLPLRQFASLKCSKRFTVMSEKLLTVSTERSNMAYYSSFLTRGDCCMWLGLNWCPWWYWWWDVLGRQSRRRSPEHWDEWWESIRDQQISAKHANLVVKSPQWPAEIRIRVRHGRVAPDSHWRGSHQPAQARIQRLI